MNNLITKNVPFEGTKLLAVQDKETGKIYASINSILRELGFDDRQIEYRRNKWIADKVLSKGVQKFLYPSKDRGVQETYCIEIKRLPLALAKIEITPKMEKAMPNLSKKLEKYEEQCADVLADAFLDNQNTQQFTLQQQIQIIAKGADELYQRVEGVEIRINDLESKMNLDHGQQRQLEKAVNKTVIDILGGKESNAYKSIGRKVFCECNGNLKDYFNVNARGDVPRKRYNEAITYAEKWRPCINTQMLIEQYNAQQTLDLEGGAYHG